MAALFWPVVEWIFRTIVIKFVVMAALFAVVGLLVPYVVGFVTSFLNVDGLSMAFANLPAGVWYFLDYFQVSFGVPLLISAYVSRFLIRRMPVIG